MPKRSQSAHALSIVLPIVVLTLILMAWHAAIVVFSIPDFILPKPLDVGRALLTRLLVR